LDIGCGIGRWAENIIDHCGEYIGTDFSDEMIKQAGERELLPVKRTEKKYKIFPASS